MESGYSIPGRSISLWLVALAACLALVLFAAFGNAANLFASGVSPTMPGVTAIARDDFSDQGRANERMALVTPARPIIPPPTSNEPFGLETVPVVSGQLFSTWRGVQDDIRAEGLVLARCRLNAERCSPAVQHFLAIIAEGRAHTGRARIGVINRAINMTIRPKSDPDHWKPPLDTLSTGTGDCKDYAIAKYVALIEAGIAEKDLRLVIVRDLALGQDHAIVATRLGPNWIILDNRWLTLLQEPQCVVWFRCLCLITMVLGNLCTRTPMATRLCFGALAMFAPYLPPSFAREFSRPTFRSFTSILDDIVFAESVLRDTFRFLCWRA